jgi:adenylylsulfate kinase
MTWRVVATLSTILIVLIYTGDITLTLQVGAVDTVIKILFYHFHERAWNASDWGMDVNDPVFERVSAEEHTLVSN